MPNEIKALFDQYGGVMRTAELREHGFYDRLIKKMIAKGQIEQVRWGYYQFVGDESVSEAAVIIKLFPDGVLCMESALDYYGYITKKPSVWHIAVDNKSSKERFNISYPSVKPHFNVSYRFTVGISEGIIDGVTLRIYDRERVICDCLRNRNKMNLEDFNEVVRNYLKDPKRDTARLIKYASYLHVDKKVRDILGVWL